jgi:hypothetical protein
MNMHKDNRQTIRRLVVIAVALSVVGLQIASDAQWRSPVVSQLTKQDERILSFIDVLKGVDSMDDGGTNLSNFEKGCQEIEKTRNEMTEAMVGILRNPAYHKAAKYCAASYFAATRRPGSAEAEVLAPQIASTSYRMWYHEEPAFGLSPASSALVEIGVPAIPFVARNLAESDDLKVRQMSLAVLLRIDGDKDVVEVRLRKTMEAEKDQQKQARLHAALKSLAEMQQEK